MLCGSVWHVLRSNIGSDHDDSIKAAGICAVAAGASAALGSAPGHLARVVLAAGRRCSLGGVLEKPCNSSCMEGLVCRS